MIWTFAALAALTQAACVTKDIPAQCEITGLEHLRGDASEDRICSMFDASVNEAFSTSNDAARPSETMIAIAINKQGTATANVVVKSPDGEIAYPEIGISVMDRPMTSDDLQKLADAVAEVVGK